MFTYLILNTVWIENTKRYLISKCYIKNKQTSIILKNNSKL